MWLPCKIHTVLTENGIRFANQQRQKQALRHSFGRVFGAHEIEHLRTNINHPWTSGQAERMNRTPQEATLKRYHYRSHGQLKPHMQTFLMAYNFARRLKAPMGLTACEYICKIRQKSQNASK